MIRMCPLLSAACSRLQPEKRPAGWKAAASITRYCSIEASTVTLPFMLSWKALLMVEASMGAVAPSAARVDSAGTSAGRAGVGDADAGVGAEAGMRMVGKVKVPRVVWVGSAGGGVGVRGAGSGAAAWAGFG